MSRNYISIYIPKWTTLLCFETCHATPTGHNFHQTIYTFIPVKISKRKSSYPFIKLRTAIISYRSRTFDKFFNRLSGFDQICPSHDLLFPACDTVYFTVYDRLSLFNTEIPHWPCMAIFFRNNCRPCYSFINIYCFHSCP